MKSRFIFFAAVLFTVSGCGLFFTQYTLVFRVQDDRGGSIYCEPEKVRYAANSIVSLTAVEYADYRFDHWIGAEDKYSPTIKIIMDANRQITAVFKPGLALENPTDNMIGSLSADFAPDSGNTWTFMVYLDADNSLHSSALDDFNEMEEGVFFSQNGNMQIIVLIDRLAADDPDDWSDSRYYKIAADNTEAIGSERLDTAESDIGELGELQMNDPQTLRNFMEFCFENFPADHYALMLWNHGGGARSITPESREICIDEGPDSFGDSLYLDEIQQALKNALSAAGKPFSTPEKLDMLSIDACIMGTVETAYEFRHLTDYFAASMANVNNGGWNYADFFGKMKSSIPDIASAINLAGLMVDSFRESTFACLYNNQTISAVDLADIEELKTAIDDLAAQLYAVDRKDIIEAVRDESLHFFNSNRIDDVLGSPYYDLNDFCIQLINNQALLSADVAAAAAAALEKLGDVIVRASAGPDYGNYYGEGGTVKRGLSIFFSNGNLQYGGISHYARQYWYTDRLTVDEDGNKPYGRIDFCTSDDDCTVESWRELMEAWYDPCRPPLGYTPGCW